MDKDTILDYLTKQKEKLQEKYGISKIGLFGSYSKNENHQDSDIDIVFEIEQDKKFSMFQYLELKKDLENTFHSKIDLVREAVLKKEIKEYIQKDIIYV
jgi:predicted nucleotidyltransferase